MMFNRITPWAAAIGILTSMIAPTALSADEVSELSRSEFKKTIETVTEGFRESIELSGYELVVNIFYDSQEPTASALQWPTPGIPQRVMRIDILGGLKRLNRDGLALAVCHELGHHLGGTPKRKGIFASWSSTEWQADYWAVAECLPKYFEVSGSPPQTLRPAELETYEARVPEACTELDTQCQRQVAAATNVGFILKQAHSYNIDLKQSAPKISKGKYMHSGDGVRCRYDVMLLGAKFVASNSEMTDTSERIWPTCLE